MDNDSPNRSALRTKARPRIHATQVNGPRCNIINWWPGALRPFESTLSFSTRFCELNAINLAQYQCFFGVELSNEGQLPYSDICRIASLLNEDVNVVKSVFDQSVRVSDGVEHRSPALNRLSELQYCSKCVELGFHSYIHEMPWLAKCPFHLTTLTKTYCPGVPRGASQMQRMVTLRELMVSSCRTWPRPNRADLHVAELVDNAYLQSLTCWIKSAGRSADRLSTGQIWDSGQYNNYAEKSYAHSIGRLRRLEKMPRLIEPLFTTIGEKWTLVIRHFSLDVKNELQRLREFAPFWRIFSFYKSAGARSNNPPAFIAKLHLAQKMLKKRHGTCQCGWGRSPLGWSSHWVSTDPSGWPYWQLKCPYEVAIDDLELGWGYPERLLSNRQVGEQLLRFIELSHIMRDAGLVNYAREANVSPEGYLYAYPQVWPCCEWNTNSPLTELMSTAAEFEVDTALRRTLKWLVAIAQGEPPHNTDMPAACVRLCETKRGLSLIKWSPQIP